MTSLHQISDEEPAHEQERAVEKFQSRWSSNKTRFIADKPPSQPRSSHHRQMSGRPSAGSAVKDSNQHKYSGTGACRARSADGRLQRTNSRWTSPSSGVIIDSPPFQPLSRQGAEILNEEFLLEESNGAIQNGLPVLGSSPTARHCIRSEQHKQSLSQAMLMDLPVLRSRPGHQMSPKEQHEQLRSMIQLALDMMPDDNASS